MGNKNDKPSDESKDKDDGTIIDENEFKSKLMKLDFDPHFILMGDSILDNIAWIEDKDKGLCVEKLLNIEFTVTGQNERFGPLVFERTKNTNELND